MDEELRRELLRRRGEDQAARAGLRALASEDGRLSPDAAQAIDALRRVDEDNTNWLKSIIRTRGWPGRSSVGADGAEAAWLLAQHADHEPSFQEECLHLLERAVEQEQASPRGLAYLTDRVLLKQGLPQRYGTQFVRSPEGLEPAPLEEPDRVDERRKSAGLGPLSSYRDAFRRSVNRSAGDQTGA
jgi:uncharacterized protein DUF6624